MEQVSSPAWSTGKAEWGFRNWGGMEVVQVWKKVESAALAYTTSYSPDQAWKPYMELLRLVPAIFLVQIWVAQLSRLGLDTNVPFPRRDLQPAQSQQWIQCLGILRLIFVYLAFLFHCCQHCAGTILASDPELPNGNQVLLNCKWCPCVYITKIRQHTLRVACKCKGCHMSTSITECNLCGV